MAKRKLTQADKHAQARDIDLLLKWRALRKAGVYDTREKATLKGLTPTRRKTVKAKFNELQGLGTYHSGVIYRPLHKESHERPIYKIDDLGRQRFLRTQKTERYVMDKEHFQVFKRKPKAIPGDSLKTPKGMIAPKNPNEKLRITKEGKISVSEKTPGLKTVFTREPLSGASDFLGLISDVESGRLVFRKNEGLQLISNGVRRAPIYGQSAIMTLIRLLRRYAGGDIWHGHGSIGNFDDWSSSSEIVHRRK